MRLVNYALPILLGGTLATACGGDDGGDGDGGNQGTVDPSGTHNTYVLSDVKVPTTSAEATSLGLNIDGDSMGRPDNALGGILVGLKEAADLDLQGTVSSQIASGAVIILADVQATELGSASGVGLEVFLGGNPSPAPCTDPMNLATCGQHLDGSGMFDVAMDYGALIVGNLVGGSFTGGPGEVTIQLGIGEEGTTLPIRLVGARAEMDVTADGLTNGRLGGAVTMEDVENDLLPGIVDVIASLLVDCDPTAMPCCPADSTGASVLTFFDEDGDCVVTLEEVKGNKTLESTLQNPDVDLFDESGEFNPRADGINDSLSLGIGFTAVKGTFTP